MTSICELGWHSLPARQESIAEPFPRPHSQYQQSLHRCQLAAMALPAWHPSERCECGPCRHLTLPLTQPSHLTRSFKVSYHRSCYLFCFCSFPLCCGVSVPAFSAMESSLMRSMPVLSLFAGSPMKTIVEHSLQRRYFIFLFVNGFIVATLSSGIVASIRFVVKV